MDQAAHPCIGCEIAAGRITPPGGFVAETEHFVVHQDPEVLVPGFFVVATKAHVRSLADLGREQGEEFARLVVATRRALAELDPRRDLTLVQEERSAHLHAWLFPGAPVTTVRQAMAEASRTFVGAEALKGAAAFAVKARSVFTK